MLRKSTSARSVVGKRRPRLSADRGTRDEMTQDMLRVKRNSFAGRGRRRDRGHGEQSPQQQEGGQQGGHRDPPAGMLNMRRPPSMQMSRGTGSGLRLLQAVPEAPGHGSETDDSSSITGGEGRSRRRRGEGSTASGSGSHRSRRGRNRGHSGGSSRRGGVRRGGGKQRRDTLGQRSLGTIQSSLRLSDDDEPRGARGAGHARTARSARSPAHSSARDGEGEGEGAVAGALATLADTLDELAGKHPTRSSAGDVSVEDGRSGSGHTGAGSMGESVGGQPGHKHKHGDDPKGGKGQEKGGSSTGKPRLSPTEGNSPYGTPASGALGNSGRLTTADSRRSGVSAGSDETSVRQRAIMLGQLGRDEERDILLAEAQAAEAAAAVEEEAKSRRSARGSRRSSRGGGSRSRGSRSRRTGGSSNTSQKSDQNSLRERTSIGSGGAGGAGENDADTAADLPKALSSAGPPPGSVFGALSASTGNVSAVRGAGRGRGRAGSYTDRVGTGDRTASTVGDRSSSRRRTETGEAPTGSDAGGSPGKRREGSGDPSPAASSPSPSPWDVVPDLPVDTRQRSRSHSFALPAPAVKKAMVAAKATAQLQSDSTGTGDEAQGTRDRAGSGSVSEAGSEAKAKARAAAMLSKFAGSQNVRRGQRRSRSAGDEAQMMGGSSGESDSSHGDRGAAGAAGAGGLSIQVREQRAVSGAASEGATGNVDAGTGSGGAGTGAGAGDGGTKGGGWASPTRVFGMAHLTRMKLQQQMRRQAYGFQARRQQEALSLSPGGVRPRRAHSMSHLPIGSPLAQQVAPPGSPEGSSVRVPGMQLQPPPEAQVMEEGGPEGFRPTVGAGGPEPGGMMMLRRSNTEGGGLGRPWDLGAGAGGDGGSPTHGALQGAGLVGASGQSSPRLGRVSSVGSATSGEASGRGGEVLPLVSEEAHAEEDDEEDEDEEDEGRKEDKEGDRRTAGGLSKHGSRSSATGGEGSMHTSRSGSSTARKSVRISDAAARQE